MIKTKIFMDDFDKPKIDKQINKWIDQHPDYIIVDVKLSMSLIGIGGRRASPFSGQILMLRKSTSIHFDSQRLLTRRTSND